MCPIYGCSENFRVPEYAHGIFAEIFNGLLFRSILYAYECVHKILSLYTSIPEIIGGTQTQKIRAVTGYAHAPFSPKF